MLAVTERCTAAHNQVRRLPVHGTAASQYVARWLAETLSGTVKGPKRVPLSFRKSLSPHPSTFGGGVGRTSHGRENRPKRSAGGPKGPPGAHLGAKTWQQLDQPVVKAHLVSTEGTQRGMGVL